VALRLRQAGRAEVSGTTITLHAGALAVESLGESVELRVGDLVATFQDAEVSLEAVLPAEPHAWLMRSAYAAAPEGRLAVWRGQATLRLGQEARVLEAGQAFPEGASGIWRGCDAWTPCPASGKLRDAALDLPGPPEDEVLIEALVRKAEERAELGVGIPVGGVRYELPTGAGLGTGEGWTLLRVALQGGWCRVTVGEAVVVSCPRADLPRVTSQVPGRGLGLRAWGGDIEVKHARWKPAN
jgi:hypothetical protein